MCLLVFAWNAHPTYRLVVAGNRDEFHERPSAALGWWKDVPGVLAGRDLRASGTWLGLSRGGRFGVVTNFRDFEKLPPPGAPSRGELVPHYLRGEVESARFLEQVAESSQAYGGFNLLVGGPDSLHYFSNRGGDRPRPLAPGIHGLSNQWLDTPWPKLVRTRERFEALLSTGELVVEQLFAMLADRTMAKHTDLMRAGFPEDWERAVSAPFVVHERYGTRCSTVVLVEHDGRTAVHERRFDPAGAQSGTSRFNFVSGEPGDRARPDTTIARRDERAGPDAASDASPE